MAELTHKQQRFVEEYVIDGNATQAAIRAGYSENRATEIGYENLIKPHIKQMVEELQQAQTSKAGITADFVLNGIKEIALKKDAKDSDRLKAYELLGKNLALFTDVSKQVLPDNLVEIQGLMMKFKTMDDSELKAILEGEKING